MSRDMWLLAALVFGGWLVFRKTGSGLVGSDVPFGPINNPDIGTYHGTGVLTGGQGGGFGPIGAGSPDTSGTGKDIQVDHIPPVVKDML